MVKKHNLILSGAVILGLGAGGYLGWGIYKDHKRHQEQERQVVAMVDRFKACPDRFSAFRECFSDEQRSALRTEAEAARDGGRFEEAARKFDMLGMNNEAHEMAGRCPEGVRSRLLTEFSIREEAVRRTERLEAEGKLGGGASSAAPRVRPAAPPSSSPAPAPSSAAAAPESASAEPSASAAPPSSASSEAEAAPAPESVQMYTTRTNPFQLDSALQAIIGQVNSGNHRAKVDAIFERLHRGGTNGVNVMDMTGSPPRTAAEALARGGDCTDLANIVIALFRELRIPGGAFILHFEGAPENVDHMVPYFQLGRRRIIVDLQTARLGDTAQGRYSEVHRLTYDQAAFMYHREQGDYFRDHGQSTEALAAYRRAVELYNRDGYAYQNIGILLEQSGDMRNAAQAFSRAAELDSRYRGDRTRGTYNHELQAAQQAYSSQDWEGCVRHFRNALASGESLNQADRQVIEQNIAACESNGRTSR